MRPTLLQVITATSPAAASASPTVDIAATKARGLDRYQRVSIDAVLTEATGGVLDVYLQRLLYRSGATEVWADWCHFAQLAAGTTSYCYHCVGQITAADIVTVGHGTAADATPALAADTHIGGHPGAELRLVFVAGASTSAGASQTIYVFGWD
jgi:hypothetical protein